MEKNNGYHNSINFNASSIPKSKVVVVDASVYQVMDGIEYSGSVGFDKDFFNYNFKLDISIGKSQEFLKNNGLSALVKKVHWSIESVGGKKVTERKYDPLFMATAGELAFKFYFDPLTRQMQNGIIGRLVRGDHIEGVPENFFGVSVGTSKIYRLPMIPLLEDFLEDYGE